MRKRPDIRKSMVLPANVTELSDQHTPLDRIRVEKNASGAEVRAFIEFDLGFGQRQEREVHDVSQLLSLPGHKEPLLEGLRAWMRSGNGKMSRDTMRLSLTEGWCVFASSTSTNAKVEISHLTLEEIDAQTLQAFVTWLNQKDAESNRPRWSKSTRRIRFLALRRVLLTLAGYPNPWTENAIQLTKKSIFLQTHWSRVAETSLPRPTVEREHLLQIVSSAEREVKATAEIWREGQELIAIGRAKIVSGKDYTAQELRSDKSLALAWVADRYQGLLPQTTYAGREDRVFYNLVFSQNGGLGLEAFRKYLYLSLRTIMPFFVLLLARTKWNVSTLAGLKLSDVQEVERFGETVILLEPTKARANYSRQSITLRAGNREDTLSNRAVLQLLIGMTERIRKAAVPADQDMFFLANPDSVKRIVDLKNIEMRSGAYSDFCTDNGLKRFTPSQIRPTIVDLMVRETGSIQQGAKVASHKSIDTTAKRYIRHRTKEKFKTQLGGVIMLGHRWAASSGQIDPRHIGAAADKFAATPGFHCFDPYDSPIAGQSPGRLCGAYGKCPTCPMMLFAVENIRDVAHALALARTIERTKYKVTTQTWINVWQPQLDAIISLLSQVPASVMSKASTLSSPDLPDPS